jgi:hypothetical protein
MPTATGPIASYLAEIEAIETEWQESCQARDAARRSDPDADPLYGPDFERREQRFKECEDRHFPRVDPRTGAGLRDEARLWRWITHRLWWMGNYYSLGASSLAFGPSPSYWSDLVTANSHLLKLGLPGVLPLRYAPDPWSEVESRDMLQTIANDLRRSEAVAAIKNTAPCCVRMDDPNKRTVVVLGETMVLTVKQWGLIRALVDAYPGRLQWKELAERSGAKDPRSIVATLRKSEAWRDAILEPEGSPLGCGLAASPR